MPVSRRAFLHTSALGAAAALTASARSLGAEAAANKIVVGLMGANTRGTHLARRFASQPGVEIAYCCDAEQSHAASAASAVNSITGASPQTTQDFRRILDDKSVDVLVVAAPDHWHAPATILACAAGKHVYCEKPACHNPREGELMVEAARKHRRNVQLGTQSRSVERTREAIARLHAGDIGRVLVARANYFNPRPSIGPRVPATPPPGLDYALWQGPAPDMPYCEFPEAKPKFHYHWHWLWHWGTGEVGNNGVHSIDVCRWGLGVDYPTRVTSVGGRYRYKDAQQTPDTNVVEIECGDQLIVWEQRSWFKGFEPVEPGYDVAFFGERGTLTIGDGGYRIFDPAGKKIEEQTGSASDEPHIQNFLTAIRENKPLNAEIAEGVKSTLMCHLANIAYRTGRSVKLDPTTHTIPNDPAATALWRRDYRPGWEPSV